MTQDSQKYIDIEEFVSKGYLLEVNRQFLHRLGLSMTVSRDNDSGKWSIVGFKDARDDPEGWIFVELDDLDKQRAAIVASELSEKDTYRQAKFGWVVQPL